MTSSRRLADQSGPPAARTLACHPVRASGRSTSTSAESSGRKPCCRCQTRLAATPRSCWRGRPPFHRPGRSPGRLPGLSKAGLVTALLLLRNERRPCATDDRRRQAKFSGPPHRHARRNGDNRDTRAPFHALHAKLTRIIGPTSPGAIKAADRSRSSAPTPCRWPRWRS